MEEDFFEEVDEERIEEIRREVREKLIHFSNS